MAFVVAIVAVAPLRAEAAHQSEMVSQILFGETAEILEGGLLLQTGTFTKIKCLSDGYEGWCQSAQLVLVADEIVMQRSNQIMPAYSNSMLLNGTKMMLPFGASLELFQSQQLSLPGLAFKYDGQVFKDFFIEHVSATCFWHLFFGTDHSFCVTPIFHTPFSRKASIVCRVALLIKLECDILFIFAYSASVIICAPSK